MMRRPFIPAVVAIRVLRCHMGLAAALYYSIFFYKADGVMSSETAKCLGLMKDDRAPFSAEPAFRKSEAGSYFYREGGTTAFIDETSYSCLKSALNAARHYFKCRVLQVSVGATGVAIREIWRSRTKKLLHG